MPFRHNGGATVMIIILPLVFIWSRAPMRYGLPSRVGALIVFAVGAMTVTINALPRHYHPTLNAAESWDSEGADEMEGAGSGAARPRLREGARIGSTVGTFLQVGRRWAFEFEVVPAETKSTSEKTGDALTTVAESSSVASTSRAAEVVRYRVLENLALQRVVEAIAQDPKDARWAATGVVTEFDGENWLLLSTVLRAPSNDIAAVAPYPPGN